MSPRTDSGPLASAGPASDGRDAVDQIEGLGDVVDVRRGGDDLQWSAVSVADQVVFAARLTEPCGLPWDGTALGTLTLHKGRADFTPTPGEGRWG